MLTLLVAMVMSQNIEKSMPFVKIESLGKNPLIESEKTIYKSSCVQSLRSFKSAPVYMVFYDGKKEKGNVLVGTVSCVFQSGNDKWMTAVLKLEKDIPENYELRAKFDKVEGKYNLDRVMQVTKCEIEKFYLKPKGLGTIFED